MLYDGDRPVDFVYLDVNPAFEAMTGLKGVVGKKVSEILPDSGVHRAGIETYGGRSQGTPRRFEIYADFRHWFDVSAYSPPGNTSSPPSTSSRTASGPRREYARARSA